MGQVGDAPRSHLARVRCVVAPLLPPHGLDAVCASLRRVRRSDTNVQGRHAARNGGRGVNVGWAESWTGGDHFGLFGCRTWVGQVDDVEKVVARDVMAMCGLRTGAAQSVRGGAPRDGGLTPRTDERIFRQVGAHAYPRSKGKIGRRYDGAVHGTERPQPLGRPGCLLII